MFDHSGEKQQRGDASESYLELFRRNFLRRYGTMEKNLAPLQI